MTTTADLITDSLSPDGFRLRSFQLRYPRFIHAEVMTHRVFSRSASSSRAIPVRKLIKDIRRDPAAPIHWGMNQKGMQASRELSGWKLAAMKGLWIGSMWAMTSIAWVADALGGHKQIVNRLIEPWSHINVLVTATDFANFYALRRHPDAQPEIRALADAMWEAEQASTPRPLGYGMWHMPYLTQEDLAAIDRGDLEVKDALKVSVARSARNSYKTFDGKVSSIKDDIDLYSRLVVSQPLHASPAEHQASPDWTITIDGVEQWANPGLHGNLTGYIQYRKTLPNEYVPG